ncbi:MAG: hypothetical protein WBM46_03920 [Polyangiales bacterium]
MLTGTPTIQTVSACCWVVVLSMFGTSASEALAQEENVAPSVFSNGYPVRFARRPLVLREGMVRADGRLTLGGVRIGSGTFSSLDIGGAVSPVENLELGLSTELTGAVPAPGGIGLISAIFSPETSYGDIPIYARYQFFEGKSYLVGVDVVFVLPTNTDFSITAALPTRLVELFDLVTMDSTVSIRYRNGDAYAAYVTDPSKATFDFTLTGAGVVNATERGYIEIGGGVGVINVGGAADAKNVVELPFYAGGGYTYKGKVLVDIFTQFGWQPLMTANGPPGRNTFNIAEDWFVTVGATVHTKKLFEKKQRRSGAGSTEAFE